MKDKLEFEGDKEKLNKFFLVDPNKKEIKETKISKFNKNLAVRATTTVGSMKTFYVFCCLSIFPFIPIFLNYKDPVSYIMSCIQLVSIPLILAGQDILNDESENRSERMAFTVNKSAEILKNVYDSLIVLDNTNKKINESMEKTAKAQNDLVETQKFLFDSIEELKKQIKAKN